MKHEFTSAQCSFVLVCVHHNICGNAIRTEDKLFFGWCCCNIGGFSPCHCMSALCLWPYTLLCVNRLTGPCQWIQDRKGEPQKTASSSSWNPLVGERMHTLHFNFSTGLSLNEVQSAFSLPLMQHLLRGIPPTVWRSSAWNCEKRWIIITWRANRADQVHTRTEGKWVSPAHFFFLRLLPPSFFLVLSHTCWWCNWKALLSLVFLFQQIEQIDRPSVVAV